MLVGALTTGTNPHTRYRFLVGTAIDRDVLGRAWEQHDLRIIPEWWIPGIDPDWVIRPEEYRGRAIGPKLLDDGRLLQGAPDSAVPDGVTIELLSTAGDVLAAAEPDGDLRVLST